MNDNIVEISFTGNNYSANIPGLPGCVSAGDSFEETKKNIREAVELHLSGMSKNGKTIPESFADDYSLTFKLIIFPPFYSGPKSF